MGLNLNPVDIAKDAVKTVGGVADKGADAFGDALDVAKTTAGKMSVSDLGHMALDGVGMIPVVGEAADLANGAWYAVEGDWANAALSAGAAIPFAGNLATGAKWAKRGIEAADTISDVARTVDRASDLVKTADHAKDAARVADDAGDAAKAVRAADDAPRAARAADDAPNAGKQADDVARVAPNATVTRAEGQNTFTWKTDGEGRFASGKAELNEDFGGGKRPQSELDAQEAAAAKGVDGDQGGHMFAYRFTRDQGEINLVPQDANLNTGAWKKMENEFADWVNNGKQVDVEVVAKRSGASDRPDTFRVSYEVTDPGTGKVIYENSKRFENAAGETFDRISSKDIETWGAAEG